MNSDLLSTLMASSSSVERSSSTPAFLHQSQPSASGSQEKSDRLAAKWTTADDDTMFDILLDAKDKAETNENGFFKTSIWQEVADAVTRSTTVGGRKDVENCKSRWQRLRKDYKVIRLIKDQLGFSWDPVRLQLSASEEAWQNWIKAHPEHHKFPLLRFPQYDALATLSGDELPSGHVPVKSRGRPPFSQLTATPTYFSVPFGSGAQPIPYGLYGAMPPSTVPGVPPSVPNQLLHNTGHPGESSRVGVDVSDEENSDSSRLDGVNSSATRPRKRRRLASPGIESALEAVCSPLANALLSLKESLDDYNDIQRVIHVAGPDRPRAKAARDRKQSAISLLLHLDDPLSDDDKARLIHIFERDSRTADTYALLADQSSEGVRKKWIEQLLAVDG